MEYDCSAKKTFYDLKHAFMAVGIRPVVELRSAYGNHFDYCEKLNNINKEAERVIFSSSDRKLFVELLRDMQTRPDGADYLDRIINRMSETLKENERRMSGDKPIYS